MDISEYGTSPHVDPLMKELDDYGLFKHVAELAAYGMTVVPPEKMGVDEAFVERLRGAILRTCEKRNGIEIGDWRTAAPKRESMGNSWLLLQEDEAFVEAATNPRMLALVRWLLGQSAVLSGHTWIIKPPAEEGNNERQTLRLHSDSHGIPPGGGSIAQCRPTRAGCAPTTRARRTDPRSSCPAATCSAARPLPHEQDIENTPFQTVPLIGKAGSLALWNGATWHASVPRTNPGLRVTLVQVFMRRHMQRIHMWEDEVDPDYVAKFPELERVLGTHMYPFGAAGADPKRNKAMVDTGTNPFA